MVKNGLLNYPQNYKNEYFLIFRLQPLNLNHKRKIRKQSFTKLGLVWLKAKSMEHPMKIKLSNKGMINPLTAQYSFTKLSLFYHQVKSIRHSVRIELISSYFVCLDQFGTRSEV